jgi:hypothetical protein
MRFWRGPDNPASLPARLSSIGWRILESDTNLIQKSEFHTSVLALFW